MLWVLAGCGAQQTMPPDALLRPAAVMSAAQLWPWAERACAYRTDDDTIVEYRLVDTGSARRESRMLGRHTAHVRLAADGSLVLPGEQDFSENVAIFYKPPLLKMPAQLHPGQAVTRESEMLIKHLDTGKVRDRGTCRVRMTLTGTQRIATDVGEIEAVIVESERLIDLKLANVVVRITSAYEPGFGLVHERVERRVHVLGVPTPARVETWTLHRRGPDKDRDAKP